MDHIPVIDIAPARVVGGAAEVASAVHNAVVDVGFFQVVGHGIPSELIDATYAQFDDLFALPLEQKAAWASPVGNPFRGYCHQFQTENTAATIESFEISSISSPDEAAKRGVDTSYLDYFDSFPWPDLPAFEETVGALFEATKNLGRTMMSLFGRALGLQPDYFDSMLEQDVSNYACKYYSCNQSIANPEVLLPEHGDSGMLTLLHQRGSYEGLQVVRRDGTRVTVPVRDDAFVINVGRLMTRWTNDRFPATPHRVITPPTPDRSRKSIVLFYLPAVDTVIEPLPVCVGEDGPHYDATSPYAEQQQVAKVVATRSAESGIAY